MVVNLPTFLRVTVAGIVTAALIVGFATDGYGQGANFSGPVRIESSSLPALVGMTGNGQIDFSASPLPRLSALEFRGVIVIPHPNCTASYHSGWCFLVECVPEPQWALVCMPPRWDGYNRLPTLPSLSSLR